MALVQHFKAVYFPGEAVNDGKGRRLTLAFSENNVELYKRIEKTSSKEIRELLGTDSFYELGLRAQQESLQLNTYCVRYLKQKFTEAQRQTTPSLSKRERRPIAELTDIVHQGDCLEVMKDIPDKSIDMILCDLPYGTTQNGWDSIIPLDRLWEQYERILKLNGTIALTAQGMFTAELMMSNPRLFKYKITWVKSKPTNFLNAKKQPLRKHEDVCIFYRKQPTYHPQMSIGAPYNKGHRKNQLTGSYGDFRSVEVKSEGARYPTDVIYCKTAESEGPVVHPTQKPVALGRYLIRTFTKPGDVVLDNACGSGSFLVSALLEGRSFVGIEKNEEGYMHKREKADYIDIANSRIAEARQKSGCESIEFNFGREFFTHSS